MNIKILVSTHKPYKFPNDTELYLPIQVGCDEVEERFGITGDNTGDNISYKHRYYSDLSAVYWAYKNLDADYIGACHYRRYFVSDKINPNEDGIFKNIFTKEELEKILPENPIIVAKKREYFIETLESHYNHFHNPKDMKILREVITEIAPDYLEAFNKVMSKTSGHIFNTFIMRKDLFDDFCSFMFPVLFELEKRVDFTGYSEYEARVCGYMAEFMLDTWIYKNEHKYKEVELRMLEKQNWFTKIYKFLLYKFFPKKRVFNGDDL